MWEGSPYFLRETLVCIRKTAARHKRGEGNRSDRNVVSFCPERHFFFSEDCEEAFWNKLHRGMLDTLAFPDLSALPQLYGDNFSVADGQQLGRGPGIRACAVAAREGSSAREREFN